MSDRFSKESEEVFAKEFVGNLDRWIRESTDGQRAAMEKGDKDELANSVMWASIAEAVKKCVEHLEASENSGFYHSRYMMTMLITLSGALLRSGFDAIQKTPSVMEDRDLKEGIHLQVVEMWMKTMVEVTGGKVELAKLADDGSYLEVATDEDGTRHTIN